VSGSSQEKKNSVFQNLFFVGAFAVCIVLIGIFSLIAAVRKKVSGFKAAYRPGLVSLPYRLPPALVREKTITCQVQGRSHTT
ncbi:MAG: hypothetical protein WCP07_07705, partial [bacterium]